MSEHFETRQITAEYWLVTLRLSEEGKMDNVRDFICNEQQMAFLRLLVTGR